MVDTHKRSLMAIVKNSSMLIVKDATKSSQEKKKAKNFVQKNVITNGAKKEIIQIEIEFSLLVNGVTKLLKELPIG